MECCSLSDGLARSEPFDRMFGIEATVDPPPAGRYEYPTSKRRLLQYGGLPLWRFAQM